jgi:predicted ABC-type ATPase
VYKKKITGVYNIGSGKSISIKNFIKKEINSRIKIISNDRINSLVSNNNKLNKKLKNLRKLPKFN